MRFSYGMVVCFLCCGMSLASEGTYRAAVIGASTANGDLIKYVHMIHEAAKKNADIVVLPSPKSFSFLSSVESACGVDNYDETVSTLSEASKQAGLYVVAHLLEKTICQSKYELIRSNLVFGRDGNIVSVYRKPLNNNVANCTTAPSDIVTFTTDFGVEFGLLMEEDLVLQREDSLKGLRNFVAVGAWASDIPFLSVSQFASSWAFTNKVNLVSSSGLYAGRSVAETGSDAGVTVMDLNKTGDDGHQIIMPVVSSTELKAFPEEDFTQYIITPLNVAASAGGYKETVCHNGSCCEFFIKTKSLVSEDVNYGLAAFNGVRQFGKYNIGAQTCAVFACAGLYKRTCKFGSNSNSTNIVFEEISIQTNSTSETTQYPIILTAGSKLESDQFNFNTRITDHQKLISLQLSGVENLLSFGIFGRDFTKDSERDFVFDEELSFKDEMQEFFDYIWIRLRILIFVVSIYFLEMM